MHQPGRRARRIERSGGRHRRDDVERRELRNGGVVKGMFGLAGSILGEGRTESDRVASCGVGGGVGTAAQGRDAAPKAAPENFDQFITGRNVVKNKAVVDRASCYYWDGNN